MTTTTPERLELSDPAAYSQRMLDLVGSRDPLAVLAETPGKIAEIVKTTPAETLRKRPFEGKWTPNEILGHFVDVELVVAYRARTILCDERPLMLGMDQDRWAVHLRHNEAEPGSHAHRFAELRRMNLDLWRSLTPEELERHGVHAERGVTRLGRLIEVAAGHDLHHLEQLERYLEALRPRRSSSG